MALNTLALDSLVGQTLGHYRLLERIGQGGMGIVYRACDEHLHRDVAVKVLPQGALADEFSRQRFRKESHALSKLSHPNIAIIHDFDTQEGIDFLVEELIPGTSLDTMLNSGPLSDRQVIDIAIQLAEGLAAAHDQGVIHRDLKPGNVRVTPDLRVKILDFGLAKLISTNAVSPGATASVTSSTSVSGTVPYMAPEQLLKQNLDARTDMWAAGCLLYECSTGRRPFVQDSVALIDEILHQPPTPPSRLNPKIPPGLEAIILKCLEKDPGLRYQSARELAVDLRRLSSFTSTIVAVRQPRRIRRRLALLGILIAVILGGIVGAVVWQRVLSSPRRSMHVTIPSDTAQVTQVGQATTLAISPNGRFIALRHGKFLALRSLDNFGLTDIPGTENGISPAFSPDGSRLAFFAGTLKVVPLAGGPITAIRQVQAGGLAMYWGEDDKIYYSAGLGTGGIWRVPAAGGEAERITQVEDAAGENAHSNPQLLPGAKALLYTALGPSGDAQDSRVMAQVINSPKGKVLVDKAIFGRYLPTGHLLYAKNDGTIFAAPFDPTSLSITGDPVAVLSNVQVAAWGGGAFLAISPSGTVAFLQSSQRPQYVFRIVDQAGHNVDSDLKVDTSVLAKTGFASTPARVSHDGRKLVLSGRAPGTSDLWILDKGGEPERLTFDPAEDERAVWSPDDRFIAYSSAQTATTRRIFVKSVASGEPPRLVRTWPRHVHISSWSPDGQWFGAYDYTAANSLDAWAISADGKKELPIASSPAAEFDPQFSPDGKWIAYQSNETGRPEIYVVPFPSLASRKQVSSDGGGIPRWDPRGHVLYYVQNGYLVSQEVSAGKEFEKGETKKLFPTDAIDFDLLPGNRFIVTEANTEPDDSPIYLIVNWFAEVKAKFRK